MECVTPHIADTTTPTHTHKALQGMWKQVQKKVFPRQ